MAWTDRSALERPDSIPKSKDPFITPKRREAHAHWQQVAGRLPKRANVLEIGAGSCLVSKWLIAARPDLTVTATDCGEYPVDLAGFDRVTFMSGVAIEHTPFVDASFDAVVSQFAFEYAKRGQALKECARVLRFGGRLSFLMHERGGALYDACALRVAAGRMVNESPSVIDLLAKAEPILEPTLRLSMYRLSLGPRIADRLQRLTEMEVGVGISLPGLRQFLEGADHYVRRPEFSTWLAHARAELLDSLFVGEDQLRAALDRDAIDELSDLARSVGLEPDKPRISDVAWAWSARKPAGLKYQQHGVSPAARRFDTVGNDVSGLCRADCRSLTG